MKDVIFHEELSLYVNNGFYYVTVGSENHNKPSFKVWINRSLIPDGGNLLKFPLQGKLKSQAKVIMC